MNFYVYVFDSDSITPAKCFKKAALIMLDIGI